MKSLLRRGKRRAGTVRGAGPLRFDVRRFCADWPSRIPALTLGPKRTAAVTELLGFINADPAWDTLRHVAYMLATIRHETAATFRPVKEWRAPVGTAHRKLQDRYWGSGFYGRGYVQLTWDWNYRKAGERLSLPLEQRPDMLLQPDVSYAVCARGMREGWFTGKKLGDYITPTITDYVRARRIVNGNDKAALIAGYAHEFELLLRGSRV